MEKTEGKKQATEIRASVKSAHISPRKARLVANLLKDLPVEDALTQLEFFTQKAALFIKKLISSAIANALHNHEIKSEQLFIKNLTVDGGRVFVHYVPRAQGRAAAVRKRTSHINLILGVSKTPFKKKTTKAAKKIEPKETVSISEEKKFQAVPASRESFGSRLKFWKKKKAVDTSQLPPKQDAKGKHYTSFDRRGNM